MKWFRLYDEIIDDPKVLCLTREVRWGYVEVMSIASRQRVRGTLPERTSIALHMRLPLAKANRIVDRLIAAGLIEQDEATQSLKIHNWDHRQYKSDDVTARTSAHRKRSRNVPANVHGNDLGTPHARSETETEVKSPIGSLPSPQKAPPLEGGPSVGRASPEAEAEWGRSPLPVTPSDQTAAAALRLKTQEVIRNGRPG